ncbi:MAG: orotidine-5'-phosphate decarboxylase [Solirubrobacterales bacterium]|nr:orotidine-5'-phosphate decarboxylase [Solirubrobacterales bacterium]
MAERESNVVLGLDPDPSRLWPEAVDAVQWLRAAPKARESGVALDVAAELLGEPGRPGATRRLAAAAVAAHCALVIDAVAPAVVAVKLQVACFERLGGAGWRALRAVAGRAREAGLLVLADAKRGDIDVTAKAYGQGLFGGLDTPFGAVRGLGADAATYAPYMGRDTIEAVLGEARAAGGGLFVLVRTSNPGAADLEDRRLADGGAVWEAVAEMVHGLGVPGPDSGLHDVGAVVGATVPEHLARARELLPRAPFLLPGVGAQGGRVEDLAPAFAPGRAAGLVTASRSIVRAHEQAGGEPAGAARAEAERLRATAWALA